jgi:hypothetical protein
MQPDLSDRLQQSFVGASSRTLSESPLINVFSIPGRCPGLEFANAFGINTGHQPDVVSQVRHCSPRGREKNRRASLRACAVSACTLEFSARLEVSPVFSVFEHLRPDFKCSQAPPNRTSRLRSIVPATVPGIRPGRTDPLDSVRFF